MRGARRCDGRNARGGGMGWVRRRDGGRMGVVIQREGEVVGSVNEMHNIHFGQNTAKCFM